MIRTISLPPIPKADNLAFDAPKGNEKRSQLVAQYLADNDELLALLKASEAAEFNRYNIEAMQSIARLCRQNLEMLRDMDRIVQRLSDARAAAREGQPANGVAALNGAIDLVGQMRQARDQTLKTTTETWYKTWQPRVADANGRKFLHEVDDVKDHLPGRTVGMDYLVYRELQLPLGEWAKQVLAARNQYAKTHGIAERTGPIEWISSDPAAQP